MLKIDNREEIKQYLLKETGSSEVTEKILASLENQDVLSMIYETQKENDVVDNYQTHSLGDINNESYKEYDFGLCYNHINNLSPFELIELIVAILTLGDYTNRAYKKIKSKINNFKQTNAAKEKKNIDPRMKDLITEVIKIIKIKDTSEEENITETEK